jgi:hypothetical protein
MSKSKLKPSPSLLCPSHAPKAGNILLGYVEEEGDINFLDNKIVVDQDFIDEASKGRDLNKRFRFAGNCSKSGCGHWDKNGSKCSLIKQINDRFQAKETNSLPNCSIRSQCVWYHQSGPEACTNCKFVIRDIRTENA